MVGFGHVRMVVTRVSIVTHCHQGTCISLRNNVKQRRKQQQTPRIKCRSKRKSRSWYDCDADHELL